MSTHYELRLFMEAYVPPTKLCSLGLVDPSIRVHGAYFSPLLNISLLPVDTHARAEIHSLPVTKYLVQATYEYPLMDEFILTCLQFGTRS